MDRLRVHTSLSEICSNVYFQPPSNYKMNYPCIIYRRSGTSAMRANNSLYGATPEYSLTVIDPDPDGTITDALLKKFPQCSFTNELVIDNLYHTYLTLYYK